MRASARRRRAAATSSIAFVILRVFATERIRRRMSWSVAKALGGYRFLFLDRERVLALLDRATQLLGQLVREVARLADLGEHRLVRPHVLPQLVLQARDLRSEEHT